MYLLDVNIIISIVDPEHIHHDLAFNWFRKNSAKGWATCPITENGFIRIISNNYYKNLKISSSEAIDALQELKDNYQEWHKFIPDNVSFNDGEIFDTSFLKSNNTTDNYLVGLAYKNNIKLLTIDREISTICLKNKRADIILCL